MTEGRTVKTGMSRFRAGLSSIQILVVAAVLVVVAGGLVYLWLGGSQRETDKPAPANNPPSSGSLSEEDRQLVARQKNCPVSGQSLESMGGPYRTEVEGKVVFLCCKNCTGALNKNPAKYLEKLK